MATSTLEAFDSLCRKLEPGSVVLFREFCGEEWTLSSEGKAFYDYIGRTGRVFQHLQREGDFSLVRVM